jgi:GT2 family glycosyltransferase
LTTHSDQDNNSPLCRLDSGSALRRLEQTANLHFPPFLKRLLPTSLSDGLRELRGKILSYYLMRHLPRNRQFEQSPEDVLSSASLSIVVPIHDAPAATKRCLMSLQRYAPAAEIILVDDASKQEETKFVLEDFVSRNRWKLARHLQPLGHSVACSSGARLATRPYLCLLNSDTVVTPWCWRPIVQTFECNPQIGVAGPSTSHAGNEQTLPLANFTRHYLNDSQICGFASRLFAQASNADLVDIPWVSGFAFFIRRSLWEDFGGFDRDLPDYGNETELCKRVLQAGYRVVWARNSYVHHLGEMSYSKVIGIASILARKRRADVYIQNKHSD